jgi:hypothetical protein
MCLFPFSNYATWYQVCTWYLVVIHPLTSTVVGTEPVIPGTTVPGNDHPLTSTVVGTEPVIVRCTWREPGDKQSYSTRY